LFLVAALLLGTPPAGPSRADDWPQWLGPRRDGVWRETGILEKFPPGGPKVRWRAKVGGGYAGPAVAGGRVYLTDRVLARGVKEPGNPFNTPDLPGEERVLCLDEATGKVLWTHAYPCTYAISYAAGPRTTPVVAGGKVFTLGAMGDLLCLDAETGKVVWSKNFPKDYGAKVPLWGYAAHPLLDGDKVICLVGGKGSVAVAFDKDTGAEKWRSLSLAHDPQPPDWEIGYCPPMIFQVGKTRQLIVWHSETVNGLNPETGEVYWSRPMVAKASMAIPTPRLIGDDLLFLTCFYNGSLLLKLDKERPAAEVVWKSNSRAETPGKTDKLHAVMATPAVKDGYIYGVCAYGELRCLQLADGKRVWEDLRATGDAKEPTERWANAFLVPQGDRYFLFNEKGDLIIARLTPKGYEEVDRAHLMEPTGKAGGRRVLWSHPAFADRCLFARNDKELICVSLAAE
jgi:outer membrane protein assembly factor BamB